METKVISTRVSRAMFDRVNAIALRLYAKSYTGQPNRTQLLMDALNLFCDLGEAGSLDGMNLSQIDTAEIVYTVNNPRQDILAEIRSGISRIEQKLEEQHNTVNGNHTVSTVYPVNERAEDSSDSYTITREQQEEYKNFRNEIVEVWQEPIDDRETTPEKKLQVLPRYQAEKYIDNCQDNALRVDDYPRVRFVIRDNRDRLPESFFLYNESTSAIAKYYAPEHWLNKLASERVSDAENSTHRATEVVSLKGLAPSVASPLGAPGNLTNSTVYSINSKELDLHSAYDLAKKRGYKGNKKSFGNSFTKNKDKENYQNFGISRTILSVGRPAIYYDVQQQNS